MSDAADDILRRFRDRGGRVTAPRRAVLDALLAADAEHVTAEEIMARVQREHPNLAPSTVYRTLDALEDMGVVNHTHLGHGPAVYHLADDPHHHLVCGSCGGVVQVPAELFQSLGAALVDQFGFVLDTRHFALTGTCRRCAKRRRAR